MSRPGQQTARSTLSHFQSENSNENWLIGKQEFETNEKDLKRVKMTGQRQSASAPRLVALPTNREKLNEQAVTFEQPKRRRRFKPMSRISPLTLSILCFYYYLISITLSGPGARAQQVAGFPGVSRDLASFCSARPSLSIDLASMVVHVKKSTSFNYKLYLFSSDNYVFQTGQIVPRDDFRIHNFPVKLKPFNEFLPANVATFQQSSSGKLLPTASSKFNAKAFFAQVPIDGSASARAAKDGKQSSWSRLKRKQRELSASKQEARAPSFDVLDHGDILPGDESSSAPFGHHDAALAHKSRQQANSEVHFDRDDQVAVLGAHKGLHELSRRETSASPTHTAHPVERASSERPASSFAANQQMVVPVGAFSSFHVNTTYLVRKDFDQSQPELVRLEIDPQKFIVTQVHLLDHSEQRANESAPANATQLDDHAFLKHKLLTDPNTRITSINQIYEDWITRNFYTIVYIQRRLEAPERAQASATTSEQLEDMAESLAEGRVELEERPSETQIVTDRLIFRGSSVVLLGADQLDYPVKASAFITEKNGLHYYLEFLTQGKFYLGAIDWSRRPFAIIDAQRLPLRQTLTKFDNEELLLCPPSLCYSERPIDELVSYGRLGLPEKLAREAAVLTRALSSHSAPADLVGAKPREVFTLPSNTRLAPPNNTVDELDHELTQPAHSDGQQEKQASQQQTTPAPSHKMQPRQLDSLASTMISLDEVVEAVRAASSQLELRLHLRDWTWTLPRVAHKRAQAGKPASMRQNATNTPMPLNSSKASNGSMETNAESTSLFGWHFEWARRNDIKVTPDTYGFVLTGHEIDASYRVYDELHLISANHLITINYTLANETVTSAQPIGDEFQGLSSSLLDPITGAFYDRYANQLYFFKGDRYVGYDYATKRPLDDFLLAPPVDALVVAASGSPLLQASLSAAPAAMRRPLTQPLVSSLPVVGILGRQHHVDAIWHDLHDDLVYIFAGAKFYAYQASEFRDGAFRSARQPAMRCINEHFLDGCRFDEAFPNPCRESEWARDPDERANEVEAEPASQRAQNGSATGEPKKMKSSKLTGELAHNELEFNEEQQMKLRSIAARGGGGGLLEVLLDNTLGDAPRNTIDPFLLRAIAKPGANGSTTDSTPQERIVIYLLIAMVLITILVTVAMIFVILNWGRSQARAAQDAAEMDAGERSESSKEPEPEDQENGARMLAKRIAYPPAISQYLSNQYQYPHHNQAFQQPLPYQYQHTRRQQVPLNLVASSPAHYNGGPVGPARRHSQSPLPLPPKSRLFESLNQKAKTDGAISARQAPKRYDIVDSSAL